MPIAVVFPTGPIQVRLVAHELEARHVAARVRICQVSRWLVNAWAWGRWAETRDLSHSVVVLDEYLSTYLGRERVWHHVLDSSDNFNLFLSVCARTYNRRPVIEQRLSYEFGRGDRNDSESVTYLGSHWANLLLCLSLNWMVRHYLKREDRLVRDVETYLSRASFGCFKGL